MKILKTVFSAVLIFTTLCTLRIPANAAYSKGDGYGADILYCDFEEGSDSFTNSNVNFELETEDTWGNSKASGHVKYTGNDGRMIQNIALKMDTTYQISVAMKMLNHNGTKSDIRLIMLYNGGTAYTEYLPQNVVATDEWALHTFNWTFKKGSWAGAEEVDENTVQCFLRIGDPSTNKDKEFLIDDFSIRATNNLNTDYEAAKAENAEIQGELFKDYTAEISYDYTGSETEGQSFYRLYRVSENGNKASVASGHINAGEAVSYTFTEKDTGYKLLFELTPYSENGKMGETITLKTSDTIKLKFEIYPEFSGNLTEGQTLGANVEFINNYDEQQKVIVVLAVFNEKNTMLAFEPIALSVEAEDKENFEPSLTVPAGAASAKIFIWEGDDLLSSDMTSYMLSVNK